MLTRLRTTFAIVAVIAVGAPGSAVPMDQPSLRPKPAVGPNCRSAGKPAMHDLHALFLRTDPRLESSGRAIKGLYYASRVDGPNELVVFQMGCAGLLDPKPFLEFEFGTTIYLLDQDGDGCTDGAGLLDLGEIDPVEFLPALPVARRSC